MPAGAEGFKTLIIVEGIYGGGTMCAFALIPLFFVWGVATAARNFFTQLFYPFTTAIIMDNRKDIASSMISRELLLNCGRVLGVTVVFFSFLLFNGLHLSLIPLGLSALLYPLLIEMKKRHISVE